MGRALQLLRLKGEKAQYVGMGLWSYGFYECGRLFITHNADGMAIRLDGEQAYQLDTRNGERDEAIGDYPVVQATMQEIDRHLVLDDLASL